MGQNAATKVLLSQGTLLNLAACAATPQPVEVPASRSTPPTTEVFLGARVRIVKLDLTLVEFMVLEITPTGLRGKDGVVPCHQMLPYHPAPNRRQGHACPWHQWNRASVGPWLVGALR